jgi:FMN-dependent NADH-azoreductase
MGYRKLTSKEISKKQAMDTARAMDELIQKFKEMKLDPEFAAFALISSGVSLVTMNNPDDPIVVSDVIAGAIRSANENAIEAWGQNLEEDDEEDEDERGKETIH